MKSPAFRTETILLAEKDREWIQAKWRIIREYHTKADAAVNKWRRISDEVNDYLDSKGVTDVYERSRYRLDSLALRDALEVSTWHRNEANAHIADVNLFLRLKELGLL